MRTLLILLLVNLSACASASKPTLQKAVEQAAWRSGGVIGVAFHDLESGRSFSSHGQRSFHAASTMKVPVMLALFEAISRGELKLEQPVLVKNEFVSISDQSVYSLESREDSDPKLYDLIGQQRPLSELMQRMIVRSSNLSTNILIDLIGAPKVMSLMGTLGANDIRVLRGVEDDKAYKAGMNNTTTASDLLLVLRAVAEEKAITPAASQAMIKIMLAQEFNEGIPAGVPAGTRVAHKTGSITSVYHDAAIVYPPDRRPYILVVLTWGWKDKRQAEAAVRRISRAAWLESVASNQ